jgi:hypothetical protein
MSKELIKQLLRESLFNDVIEEKTSAEKLTDKSKKNVEKIVSKAKKSVSKKDKEEEKPKEWDELHSDDKEKIVSQTSIIDKATGPGEPLKLAWVMWKAGLGSRKDAGKRSLYRKKVKGIDDHHLNRKEADKMSKVISNAMAFTGGGDV